MPEDELTQWGPTHVPLWALVTLTSPDREPSVLQLQALARLEAWGDGGYFLFYQEHLFDYVLAQPRVDALLSELEPEEAAALVASLLAHPSDAVGPLVTEEPDLARLESQAEELATRLEAIGFEDEVLEARQRWGRSREAFASPTPPAPKPLAERIHVTGLELADARAFFDRLQAAVRADDPSALSALVEFPIRVRVGDEQVELAGAADLVARYPEVFCEELKRLVLTQRFEELVAFWIGLGIANGAVWFTGVCADDVCSSVRVRVIRINGHVCAPGPAAP